MLIAALTFFLIMEERGESATLTFTAEEYAFTGPEQVDAGWQTVRLVNHGREIHQIQFLELQSGKTIRDLRQALAGQTPILPSWLRRHGGVNSVAPGSEASILIKLDPGNYVLLCGIPDAAGQPHAMKGMVSPLRVNRAALSDLPQESDTTVYLKEFYFSVTSPLRPGNRILRVVNEGTQAHELTVIRLAEGSSVQDILTNYRTGGSLSPAGIEVGGLTGLDPGHEAFVYLDLQPGRYAFICFLADPITLSPHFARGMWMDLHVRHPSVPMERP